MNWDKKTIGALFASIVIFTVYMSYLQRKYPDYYAGRKDQPKTAETVTPVPTSPAGSTAPSPGTDSAAAAPVPGTTEIALLSPEQLRIETKTRVFDFDQQTASIKSVLLKDFRQNLNADAPAELLDSPLAIQATTQVTDRLPKQGFSAQREGNRISFLRREGNWEITETYTIPDEGYGLELTTQFRNLSAEPLELTAGIIMQETLRIPASGGGMFSFLSPAAPMQSFVYSLEGKHEEKMMKEFCSKPDASGFTLTNEKVDFLGIDRHYFLSFLWSKDQALNYELHHTAAPDGLLCPLTLVSYQKFGRTEPGAVASLQFAGYFGPKQLNILEAHDPLLKTSLKLGWFSIFARPLLAALKGLYALVHNYGVAIILITLLLKMAFFPLTRAAAISMKKMQKLQPEMNRLKEKFKDDPQRQQRELMAFMGQHKVNPLKGCLPILPQIPVFIAFYNVLSQAIELRHAPFYGWLTDLASRDPYFVTPLFLGLGMFLQQKLTPNPGMDKNQEKIMLMMPVIFTVMMLSLPAGMVLYMITNTIVSILQQQWLNRRLAKTLG